MGRNNFTVTVIADDRESKSEVIQFLSEMKNVSVGIKRLSLGDYLVDNRLVFERKTLVDFARSIVDGRLFRQAIRLSGAKYKSVLILEGTGKDLQSVAGIGKQIAEKIRWAVSEQIQAYGISDEFPI